MNGTGISDFSRADNGRDIQVTFCRWRRANTDTFIGQQDMAKDRTRTKAKLLRCGLEHTDTENVRREQIRGELNPPEGASHGCGQGPGQRRLADTGNILDQKMTTGQEGDDGLPDHIRLAMDDAVDGVKKKRNVLRRGLR